MQLTLSHANRRVGFIDAEGPGHASQAGSEGATCTLRVLRGTRLVNLHENVPDFNTATGGRI